MAAVRSIKNQYLGINAHLHSYWQARGGWPEFHTPHIVSLFTALKPLLMPLGYKVAIEPALQIRRIDFPEMFDNPTSDVTIYDPNPLHTSQSTPAFSAVGELVIPMTDAGLVAPVSEREYRAIKIYDPRLGRGEPVVWIELLSPSNKPGSSDAKEYFDKRENIIEAGIVVVEIDYLHESTPTLPVLPSYRSRHLLSSDLQPHPYYIVVSDPRPTLAEGVVRIIGFDADQLIPTVIIPLNGEDVLTMDFGKPYQKTLEETLYAFELVDYSEFPERFNRYREDDQRRIALRMLSVLEAAHAGVDLESGPFPVKDLSLDDALKAIETVKANG